MVTIFSGQSKHWIQNNESFPLVDYAVDLIVSNGSGLSTGNQVFLHGGILQPATFNDIRFYDGAGREIPYWIETPFTAPTGRVWIKMQIPIGGCYLYLKYGNKFCYGKSDITQVGLFGDNFNDLAKWNTTALPYNSGTGTIAVSNGVVTMTSTNGTGVSYTTRDPYNLNGVSIRYRITAQSSNGQSSAQTRFQLSDNTTPDAGAGMGTYEDPTGIQYGMNGTLSSSGIQNINISTPQVREFSTLANSSMRVNNAPLLSVANTAPTLTSKYLRFWVYYYASTSIDWIIVKRATANPPTHGETIEVLDYAKFSMVKEHDLGGSASPLTDYQVQVYLNLRGFRDSGNVIGLMGKCQPDFSDVRFLSYSGKQLEYGLVEIINGIAEVWVKMDTIPTSGCSFTIFSGMAGLPIGSNGNAALPCYMTTLGSSTQTFGPEMVFESRISYPTNIMYSDCGFQLAGAGNYQYEFNYNTNWRIINTKFGTSDDLTTFSYNMVPANRLKIVRKTASVDYYINGQFMGTKTGNMSTMLLPIMVNVGNLSWAMVYPIACNQVTHGATRRCNAPGFNLNRQIKNTVIVTDSAQCTFLTTTTLSAGTNNVTSTLDGDMVSMVVDGNLVIPAGATLTTSNRCKGLKIIVKGDLTVGGVISMTARGANAVGAAVGVTGAGSLTKKSGDTGKEFARVDNGKFVRRYSRAYKAFLQRADNAVTQYTVPAAGADGGAVMTKYNDSACGVPGNNGTAGTNGKCGGGGSGHSGFYGSGTSYSGAGTAGTSFSGGAGGGAAAGSSGYAGTSVTAGSGAVNGGAGGAGKAKDQTGNGYSPYRVICAGGAGNPGGPGSVGVNFGYNDNYTVCSGASGTGGLLIIIVYGNVIIGSTGVISSNGSPGGGVADGSSLNYAGYRSGAGGGSGGGSIVIAYGGEYTNSGTVQTNGGAAGNGHLTSDGASYDNHGGAGGAGSIIIQKVTA